MHPHAKTHQSTYLHMFLRPLRPFWTAWSLLPMITPVTFILSEARLWHELTRHNGGVWGLTAHDDTLVGVSGDRTIRVWDLWTGEC
jgi:WD40 repeat protein